jgi:hypothetical protein
MPKVLIIIPAFNEEATLATVIGDLREHVPEADIAVVNDGSGDRTGAIAEEAGVIALHHPYNLGIGATMQTGYKYALRNGYDIAVQVDGDGQHRADQLRALLAPITDEGADIVVGSRFLGLGEYSPSIARSAGIRFFSKLVSAIIGEHVTDTTSGFRASGKRTIQFFSSHYPDDYPEVETLVLLHKLGFNITEVPVKMRERAGGESSITPVRSVYYMVKVLLAILIDMIKKLD